MEATQNIDCGCIPLFLTVWTWSGDMATCQKRIFAKCKQIFDTLRPRWNARHFAECIYEFSFLFKYCFSLKYVLNGPTNIKPSLVQIMPRCQKGDDPLSGLMLALFNEFATVSLNIAYVPLQTNTWLHRYLPKSQTSIEGFFTKSFNQPLTDRLLWERLCFTKRESHQGPLSLTWFNFNPNMDE